MSELYLIITVINRDDSEDYIAFYQRIGAKFVLGALGHGTADSKTMDYLGLKSKEKAVLFTMAEAGSSSRAMRELNRKSYITIPGNGIALCIPVSSIGGSMMKYLFQKTADTHQVKVSGGENMMETEYRLIVVVTNHGYTDMVMDLARSAGASGGTIIRAIGTGQEQAEKFFGMTIAKEKEIIFIVCPKNDQSGIMKAVVANAGMKSKAQSLVFSVPVESVAGLRDVSEDDDTEE